MSSKIYIEGGGSSKELSIRCRRAFQKLFERCGFKGRMPQTVACGSRNDVYDSFKTAHAGAKSGEFIALLVDSEDPVADIERTWSHLQSRDGWAKPAGAEDEQVLLMTTCMETWIVADREALKRRFPNCLQESALPSLHELESRSRQAVQELLAHATRTCKQGYAKGKVSFELLEEVRPEELRRQLPSFERLERVLQVKLSQNRA